MDGKRKFRRLRDRSILGQFTAIAVIAAALLIGSFLVTNHIAEQSLHSDYMSMNDSLFEQMSVNLQNSVDNVTEIAQSISQNVLIANYIEDGTLYGRSDVLSDVRVNLQSFRSIQEKIAQIVIYDGLDQPIANVGGIFIDQVFESSSFKTRYYAPVEADGTGYFALSFPILDNEDNSTQMTRKVGSGNLLVEMDLLSAGISDSLPTPDSWFALLGTDGSVIIQAGVIPEDFSGSVDTIDHDWFNVYQSVISGPGWRAVLAVPKQTQYAGLNSLQHINLFSYAVLSGCLLLIILLLYFQVLRPIRSAAEFMSYYATHPESKSRMQQTSSNEIGILTVNLNHMLDEIERLTAENIHAREQILQTRSELLELDYRKKQTELLAYRNQINPHFLYNTFECIRGMALYYNVGEIAKLTEALSRFFRYSVQGKGYTCISEIIDHIRDYAEIIGYRFMNRYRIGVSVDPNLLECSFPKMILQPLVENAVFHGCEPAGRDAEISVSIQEKAGQIHLEVRDNGCGMTQEQLALLRSKLDEYRRTNLLPNTKHGIGMLNVYRRLLLFYGDQVKFDISSKEGEGTVITIEVPAAMSMEEKDEDSVFC